MFGWYRDSQKTSLITHDDSEILNISTDSKSIRKPYKYKESWIDIGSIFDQYIGLTEHIHKTEIDTAKQGIAKTLTEKHEKYVDICTNEIYQKYEQERHEINEKFKHEKGKELKILENKIKKDYDEKRVKMYEEFEILKSQFSEQFSQQTNEYQNLANQDLQKQKEEFEKQKEQYEIKYEEKVQRKTQLLEGIFAKRQAELEDEFSLKKQKLEFDIKNIAESQDSKYKADIEKMIAKFETQSQEKVKRIESETQDQIQEYLEKINQKFRPDHEIMRAYNPYHTASPDFTFDSRICQFKSSRFYYIKCIFVFINLFCANQTYRIDSTD